MTTERDGGAIDGHDDAERVVSAALRAAADVASPAASMRARVMERIVRPAGAFVLADLASPSPVIRDRVAAGIEAFAQPATVSWLRRRRVAVAVAAAVAAATLLVGALASALPGLYRGSGEDATESDRCVVPWEDSTD